MSRTSWHFSSPLSLLNGWRDRADQAPLREVLLLGFTVDLQFLEQVAIPAARGLGARITVLGDAGQGLYDPVDVRLAGRSYLHSLVTCGGAFHPKLVLLIGADEVQMAVGSGNPTMSGWGANDELWTVISSGSAIHPVIAEAGAWLRRLAEADRVSMTWWTADVLREIADDIANRPTAEGDPRVRLLDNLDQSFLQQLPSGPVDELCLYAPFTDARAIGELITCLRPRSTVLGLQPRWTGYDGDALLATLAGHDVELRYLEEKSVRHGKFVQWRIGEWRYGLVGSPNLTRSALCSSTAEGGNCELAILAPLPGDLMPEGVPAKPGTMAGRSTVCARKPTPSLILLGALVGARGLEVTLAKPQKVDVVITSSPDGAPGTWEPMGVIPPGEVTLLSAAPGVASQFSIRAEMTLPGGDVVHSPPVFAVNPARCARRNSEVAGPRLRQQYTVEDIFTDQKQAELFTTDLIRLAKLASRDPGMRPTGESGGDEVRSAIVDPWSAHLEDCREVYGYSLTGLIYPSAAGVSAHRSRTSRWELSLSAPQVDEADDEDPSGTDSAAPKKDDVIREVCRRWAGRWVNAVTRPQELPPLPLRILVTELFVRLLAAGAWSLTDDSWRDPLARLTRALVPAETDDPLEETVDRLCNVAATCMALLCQDASLTGGAPNDLLAARTWVAVKSLVARADPESADDLPASPSSFKGDARVVSAHELRRLIDLAGDDGPAAEIRIEIEAKGWNVTERNGLWEVIGDFTNPIPVAARLVTRIGVARESAVVLARTARSWALIAWRKPELVLLSHPGCAWRHYRITPPGSPESRFSTADISAVPGQVGRTVPMNQEPPEDARRVFADCGFDPIELRDRILNSISRYEPVG